MHLLWIVKLSLHFEVRFMFKATLRNSPTAPYFT